MTHNELVEKVAEELWSTNGQVMTPGDYYDEARAAINLVVEECARVADTNKGYPTPTSEAIRALKQGDGGER